MAPVSHRLHNQNLITINTSDMIIPPLTQGLGGGVHLNPLILVAAHEEGLAGADRA